MLASAGARGPRAARAERRRLRRGDPEVIDSGPFRALLDPTSDLAYLNYAVPVEAIGRDDDAVAADLGALGQAFAARGRRLRLEFTAELWPALGPMLDRLGLALESDTPTMIARPGDLRPAWAPGVDVRPLADELEEVGRALALLNVAFGLAGEPEAARVRSTAEQLRDGRLRGAQALLRGEPAGCGFLTPFEGCAELAGVGTLPAMRRRGVAATLSSALAEAHFRGGGDVVWLSAGDAAATAVYQGIGFRTVARRLSYIEPERHRP